MPLPRPITLALRFSAGRHGVLRVALLGTLLFVPCLWRGLNLDDHLQRIALTGAEPVRGLGSASAGMFGFVGFEGRAQTVQAIMTGALPWWASPDMRLNFWRPLSELTHRVDYILFPDSPALMHAHSLLWYFLLLVAATLLYRRIHVAPASAALCALLYTLDDGHAVGASWIANRSGVISALFVVLTVYFHDRARRTGHQLSALSGWLIAVPGLLSGEAYVAVLGYLFAHAITLDRGRPLERVQALTPYLAIVLGWHAIYARLGYGSAGSAMYLDPGRDPVLFAAKLFPRLSLLLGSHFAFGVPEVAGLLSDRAGKVLATGYLVLLIALGWLMWPVLRKSATARFWGLGAVLSAVPFCATLPMERNLLIPGIGAMGLLGKYLADYFQGGARERPRRLVQACAGVFLVQHLVLSPIGKPVKAIALPISMERADACGSALASMDDLVGRFAVALNATDGCAAYGGIIAQQAGLAMPLTLRTLSDGYRPTEVERVDPNTLRIRPEGGFFTVPVARLFFDVHAPMTVGKVVQLPELTITVVETTRDGRPAAIEARFAQALDGGRYRLLVAEGNGLREIEPPTDKLTLAPAFHLGR